MVEYLESRELLSGNPPSNAVDSWQTPVPETVVVSGDLWGNGQKELIRYDSASGQFIGEWKSGDSITQGTVAAWAPGLDLQYLTVKDLNYDGRGDIIAMDRTTGRWAASTSLPGGSYSTRYIGTWQTGVNWQSVTFADLNADGFEDVMALDPTTSTWNVLLGGNGAFQSTSVLSPVSSGNIASVVVDNFDGVAGADIVVRDGTTGGWTNLSYASNKFNIKTVGNWSPAGTWVDVNTVDFWGTGRKAIIGRHAQTNEWRLTWSAGSGTTTSQLTIWGAGTYADAQIADLNQDGREDLVARQVATGRWYMLSSSATSIQTSLIEAWTPNTTYAQVWSGDFNGDSRIDLIGLDSNLSTWQGLLSTTGGAYTTQTLVNPEFGFNPTNLSMGDFDIDGRLDVIGRGTGTDNWQTVSVINGQLTPSRFDTWAAYGTGADNRFGLDFNGDIEQDFLARDSVTGDWWLTSNAGATPTVSKVGNWNPSITWQAVQAVDFDGNGTVDIVGRNTTTGDWHLLRMANGTATSTIIGNWSTAETWTDYQVADLLGNGRPVIVARDTATNHWQGLWSAGGGFSSSQLNGLAPGRTYVDTRVVSFFGDGRQAVVTRDSQTGAWYAMWTGSNQFRLTNLGTWSPSGTWDSVAAADLEGSGRQSLLGHDAVTGEWRRITFDGVAPTSTVITQTTPNRTLELASVGNFVDATRDSILTRDATTGSWQRLSFSGTDYEVADLGVWSETTGWTTTWVRDFNRDGRADLFGADSPTATWSARTAGDTSWRSMQVTGGTLDRTVVPVPDDSELKNEIIASTPGLAQAIQNGDKFAVANHLLNWIAVNVDDSMFQSDADATLPIVINQSAAYSYYRLFRPNRGAVFCGGYAVMYQKLLLSFGVDALSIDYGDANAGLTHMSVVIPHQQANGSWKFYQFDPTLNFRCVDASSGALLGLFEVMDREIANQLSTVTILQGSNAGRDWVSPIPFESDARYTPNGTDGGRYLFRRDDYTLNGHLSDYGTELSNAGFTTGPAGFFELQQREFFSVRLGNNAASRNAFLQELQNRSIPLRYPTLQ